MPGQIFTVPDVMERLKDATSQDSRWSLLFWEKVMPEDMPRVPTQETLSQALDELLHAQLIRKDNSPKVKTEPALYSMTEKGTLLNDNLSQTTSKVALSISIEKASRVFARHTCLYSRATDHLWLFQLAYSKGKISTLDSTLFKKSLAEILASQKLETPATKAKLATSTKPDPTVSDAHKLTKSEPKPVLSCPKCKEPYLSGDIFCTKCGSRLP